MYVTYGLLSEKWILFVKQEVSSKKVIVEANRALLISSPEPKAHKVSL